MWEYILFILVSLNPYPIPHEYWTPDPSRPLLATLHSGRYDLPRLFVRGGQLEIGCEDLVEYLQPRLSDLVLRARYFDGSPSGQMNHARYTKAFKYARDIYERYPHQPLTDKDVTCLRAYLLGRESKLFATLKPEAGYARCGKNGVTIPRVAFTSTGWCDRSIIIHEMTHFFQQHSQLRQYSNQFDSCEAEELGPIIAETAEKIRQGYTAELYDKYDRMRWPVADILPLDNLYPATCLPRMRGSLLVQYVKQYGPHLTGDVLADMDILEEWTAAFENTGDLVIPMTPRTLAPEWMAYARFSVYMGDASPLFSTAQTYLAINGAPTWYPQVLPIAQNDYAKEPRPINLETITRTKSWQDLPETTKRAALVFLGRCEPRQEE